MKGFTSRVLHAPYPKKDVHAALRMPVYKTAAYEFDRAEDIADAFSGKVSAHTYSRATNPTVEYLETLICHSTQAQGVLAVSSGMAAISCALLALLEKGDNLITTYSLFGNTLSLLGTTFSDLGIEARFAPVCSFDALESRIDQHTRLLFIETISNPGLEVPEIKKLATLCQTRGILLVVDSTLSPFCSFSAKEHGVDIEIVSSTKLISGGGTSVGGFILDYGTYNYSKIPKLNLFTAKFAQKAFLAKLRKEIYRNLGACLSPDSAFLQTLGMETLQLRAEKTSANAQQVAEYLFVHPSVVCVRYPGLPDDPFHQVAKSQFGAQFGALVSFDLQDKQACFSFLNKLQLIRRATNLCDNKTLAIHPASTIYCEYSTEQLGLFRIADNSIRLSVGIEDVDDLIADISQALLV